MSNINFTRRFGAPAKAEAQEKVKSQFWLNVGYTIEVDVEGGGTEKRFVSTAFGIPLDTQEVLPTNSRNRDYAAFQAARNELTQQLIEAGQAQLEPGGEMIVADDPNTGLQIQLRRVNDDSAPITPSANPYIRPIKF